MIKPETEDSVSSSEMVTSQRLYGCQWNVVYGRPQHLDGTLCLFIFICPPIFSTYHSIKFKGNVILTCASLLLFKVFHLLCHVVFLRF